jgi:hypothetical protein
MSALYGGKAFCQMTDTARVRALSTELSISHEKAKILLTAIRFNQAAIKIVEQNAALKPNEKQAKIRLLMEERQRHINAALTLDELQKFNAVAAQHTQARRRPFEDALAQKKQTERSKEPVKKP